MKVHVAALFALLIVGSLAVPVFARDVKVQVPGWEKMSDKDKAKTIKEISRKNNLKPGRDKIIIEYNVLGRDDDRQTGDGRRTYYSSRGNWFICWFLGC
jgi:hypothetical protein